MRSNARIRATAIALTLFSVHAFGDAISPALIGRLSDRYSLRVALFAALVAIAWGGAVLFAGAQLSQAPDKEFGAGAEL